MTTIEEIKHIGKVMRYIKVNFYEGDFTYRNDKYGYYVEKKGKTLRLVDINPITGEESLIHTEFEIGYHELDDRLFRLQCVLEGYLQAVSLYKK